MKFTAAALLVFALTACSDPGSPPEQVAFYRAAGEFAGGLCTAESDVATEDFEGLADDLVDAWWEGYREAYAGAGC